MQIEVHQHEGLQGAEVWVRVLSNEAVDWPRIHAKLDQETRDILDGWVLDAWHPGDAEKDAGWLFDEWFIWRDKP